MANTDSETTTKRAEPTAEEVMRGIQDVSTVIDHTYKVDGQADKKVQIPVRFDRFLPNGAGVKALLALVTEALSLPAVTDAKGNVTLADRTDAVLAAYNYGSSLKARQAAKAAWERQNEPDFFQPGVLWESLPIKARATLVSHWLNAHASMIAASPELASLKLDATQARRAQPLIDDGSVVAGKGGRWEVTAK